MESCFNFPVIQKPEVKDLIVKSSFLKHWLKMRERGCQMVKRRPTALLHTALTQLCLSFQHGSCDLQSGLNYFGGWNRDWLEGMLELTGLTFSPCLDGSKTEGNRCVRLFSSVFWRVCVCRGPLWGRRWRVCVLPLPPQCHLHRLCSWLQLCVCDWFHRLANTFCSISTTMYIVQHYIYIYIIYCCITPYNH